MASTAINIDVIFNAVNKTTSVMSQVNKGFSGMVGNMWKVNQGVEAFDKLNQSIEGLSDPGKKFEYGVAEMSAITGTVGEDLKKLEKQARKTGISSGLGAEGSIEAYKLLASQIDVTKEGMDGLNKVHADTITLASTSKELGLAGAANALAGTLNQFNLTADQSGRVMNVLAAGAKYGAAEVPDLTQSFKVAGAAASAAGLNVEQTGGALETLSKMNIKGSEAGTALRNVLLKMQTELGFDFKVTKLSDALATLQGKEGDAAYMAKIFGAENIAAAQFLVKNAADVEEMTGRMTDTKVATEQAAIMNATFTHRMDVMKAKMNDLLIGFYNHNKGLLQTVQIGGEAARTITALSPVGNLIGGAFKGAFSGIMNTAKAAKLMSAAMAAGKLGTYSDLIARYGAAGKVAAVGLKISTVAQGAWNAITGFTTATMVPLIASTWAWTAALLANPITWVVVGVAALIAGLALAWKHFAGFRGAVVGAWEGIKQFGVILWQSIINPIKQILSGLGAIGKAIGLAFKGKFGEAAAAAKEGFSDVVAGAVKSTPMGVAVQVASRRQEIVDQAAAGFQKGKAIQPGKKTEKITSAGSASGSSINGKIFAMPTAAQQNAGLNANGTMPTTSLPVQTHVALPTSPVTIPGAVAMNRPSVPGMTIPGTINANQPAVSPVTIPGTINAAQPTMKVVKAPGMISPVTMPQPAGVTVPGAVAMNAPTVPGMDIPGTINAAQPTMKVVKAPGMISPVSMPQPAGVTVPGAVAMKPLNPLKGTLQATPEIAGMPTIPGMRIPGQVDAQAPQIAATVPPLQGAGGLEGGILNVQKIQALNFLGALSFAPPKKIDEKQATKATGNMVDLTKNITNNIQKNVTNNSQANTTNTDSQAKIQVTYSPVINISSAMDQKATDDLMKMLADNKDELMKLINEEMRRNNRLAYAG